MKVVAKYIDMLVWFALDGTPNPIHFKYDDNKIIKVDRVISRQVEKFAGNNMIVFTCQSCIDGEEKIFEIKYEILTCKWMLFKM